MSGYDDKDWHDYKCANDHLWWSAPTSNRCPVCGTTTYTPGSVLHGQVGVMVPVKEDEAVLLPCWDDE